LEIEYFNRDFESLYPEVKTLLKQYGNSVFNLDQCGYSAVSRQTLSDIMNRSLSTEIFYTFSISSLVAFLHRTEPEKLAHELAPFNIKIDDVNALEPLLNKNEWLGGAERVVFETFSPIARFVSPFSIKNPAGWQYWLLHFSNVYQARQVYNNILHKNASLQAHFGRSGLNMLHYDPKIEEESSLYLFEEQDRENAAAALLEDIPNYVSRSGDAMSMGDFYENIYNDTPAHANDIHQAMIDNPDLQVITPNGGERRVANTIGPSDVLKLNQQLSFFLTFSKK